MPLKAGQFSMHHGLCPHRSGPNTLGYRRIGLGLNFVPASVKPAGTHRMAGMCVRGRDLGHLEPVSAPAEELSKDAIATHEMAVTRYRASYIEQEALHQRLIA
jgi:non-haem Fe2+, alpha-ketoglutarate-dependent halogenase